MSRTPSTNRCLGAVAIVLSLMLSCCFPAPGASQTQAPKPGEPTDPKARKTFAEAVDWQNHGAKGAALDDYRKANKQDGGRCTVCLDRAYELALEIGDYKAAEGVMRDWLPLGESNAAKATMHFKLGMALQREGMDQKGGKQEACFNDSCSEFKAALDLDPGLAAAHYSQGISLAYLHQDDAARAEFRSFLSQDQDNFGLHERASRFIDRVELARARLAPAFALTTIDGRQITMDGLAGKVVLIDFWATWCGPCREALPHIREIARRFQGQPFAVLSVSMDDDDAKWREFVNKNEMTWLQYRDGRFTGPMATRFGVRAIPSTFSIDADGVLEDQHVGDADIEGKLKKMSARAIEVANRKPVAAADPAHGSGN